MLQNLRLSGPAPVSFLGIVPPGWSCWLVCAAAMLIFGVPPAQAQQVPVGEKGGAVITRFSGMAPLPPIAPGTDPNDVAFISVTGPSAQIFDLSRHGGQDVFKARTLAIPAANIGQVFGIALDDGLKADGSQGAPNIYLGASSVYGLNIVAGSGTPNAGTLPRKLQFGQAAAQWMAGQIGPGGGPGSIWKVDGTTGAVSLFANAGIDGLPNSGPGLGGLAFDPSSRQLYASDLETGMIHRFDLNGTALGYYDHGVDGRLAAGLAPILFDPAGRMSITSAAFSVKSHATWGYASKERMILAVAIDGARLYYAIADGPQVWSVGLNPDGSIAGDARIETRFGAMPVAVPGGLIADLTNALDQSMSSIAATGAAMPARQAGGCDQIRSLDETSDALYKAIASQIGAYPAEFLQSAARIVDQDADFKPAASGQLGQTRIWRPCSAARPIKRHAAGGATAMPDGTVTGQPEPAPLAAGEKRPRIVLAQRCAACATGGTCSCRISLANSGNAAARARLTLDDLAHVLSGPQAGQPAQIVRVKPDAPGWNCTLVEAGHSSCAIAGAGFWPGSSRYIDVDVATNRIVEAGSFGVRNCASLLQSADASAQTACSEIGSEVRVALTGSPSCIPGEPCQFEMTISNVAPTPFEGDLAMSGMGALGSIGPLHGGVSISPPLSCRLEPTQLPFSCDTHVRLEPGEQRQHQVAIAYSGDTALTGPAVICVAVTDPLIDASRLLPGLPPRPLEGPGYSCVPFMFGTGAMSQNDKAGGAGNMRDASGTGGAGNMPGGSGAGGAQAGNMSGSGKAGSGAGGATSGGSKGDAGVSSTPGDGGFASDGSKGSAGTGGGSGIGRQANASSSGGSDGTKPDGGCPPGMMRDGTQCYCLPRGYAFVDGTCVQPAAFRPKDSGGGFGGDGWPQSNGWSPQCPGGQSTGSVCCSPGTVWNGLRCASGSGDSPNLDYGGMAPAPCEQPGLVRVSADKCDCPPYLDRHVDASANTICCLVPCGAGQKRVNAQCVPDCEAQGLQLKDGQCGCPPGQEKGPLGCMAPRQAGIGGSEPAKTEAKCPNTMEMRDGQCGCPSGKQWNGTMCAESRQLATVPPPAQPTVFVPSVAAPIICPATMELIGTQCICPPRTVWNGSLCAHGFLANGGPGKREDRSERDNTDSRDNGAEKPRWRYKRHRVGPADPSVTDTYLRNGGGSPGSAKKPVRKYKRHRVVPGTPSIANSYPRNGGGSPSVKKPVWKYKRHRVVPGTPSIADSYPRNGGGSPSVKKPVWKYKRHRVVPGTPSTLGTKPLNGNSVPNAVGLGKPSIKGAPRKRFLKVPKPPRTDSGLH